MPQGAANARVAPGADPQRGYRLRAERTCPEQVPVSLPCGLPQ